MKGPVVIFGANGFIGRYLTEHYLRKGREVVTITRQDEVVDQRAMHLKWDGRSKGPWCLALEGAALVINLAGRSVNCRYNKQNREQIFNSRTESTKVIGEAIAKCKTPPLVWMNSSTATIYRHAEDKPQDEWSGERGEGFSVDVATAWEEAFFAMGNKGQTRKIALRAGMVLANEPDTVLDKLIWLSRIGLGGAMGSGEQRVSWIHMDDVIAAIDMMEDNFMVDGVVNLTAPGAVTNRHMMSQLRNALHIPFGLPAARWMLEIGSRLLRTETELVLKSRWVYPKRLMDLGFEFRWPELGPAFDDLLGREGLAEYFEGVSKRSNLAITTHRKAHATGVFGLE